MWLIYYLIGPEHQQRWWAKGQGPIEIDRIIILGPKYESAKGLFQTAKLFLHKK